MESIIIIYFCLLVLTFVSNGVGEHSLVETLNQMAKEKEKINDILEPLPDGYLGQLAYTHAYKGLLLPTNTEVAMKFRSTELHDDEYDMCTYLNAINKPEVEANGIPAIYYYGRWETYTVMAITLFDPEFHMHRRGKKFNKMDILIIFREYVRASKYIHSRGLYMKRDDDQLGNMRFRKQEGFICDFFLGLKSLSRRGNKQSAAQDDWKSFFCNIYYFLDDRNLLENLLGLDRMSGSHSFATSLIGHSKTNEQEKGLRRVFIEFAKRAYSEDIMNATSFYDQLYDVIVEALGGVNAALPSWLSEDDRRVASLASNTVSSISNISDPFTSVAPVYDEVNYEYFVEFYRKYYDKINREAHLRGIRPDRASSSRSSDFDFGPFFQEE